VVIDVSIGWLIGFFFSTATETDKDNNKNCNHKIHFYAGLLLEMKCVVELVELEIWNKPHFRKHSGPAVPAYRVPWLRLRRTVRYLSTLRIIQLTFKLRRDQVKQYVLGTA
jgi:hypothetical protein